MILFQARILGWVAISSSKGSSRPRDRTLVSCTLALTGGFFTSELPGKPSLYKVSVQFSSVQSLRHVWPHGLQHTRLPCPSPTPGAYSNSCLLSQWYHPTISSLSSPLLLPSIFPSIRVFSNELVLHIRWQSVGVSALASVLPMNVQHWSPLGWTDLISLQPKGLSRVFSNTTVQKHQFFGTQLSL